MMVPAGQPKPMGAYPGAHAGTTVVHVGGGHKGGHGGHHGGHHGKHGKKWKKKHGKKYKHKHHGKYKKFKLKKLF